MKFNFVIPVSDKTYFPYKQVLTSLGYKFWFGDYDDRYTHFLVHNLTEVYLAKESALVGKENFNNLEEFLISFFKQETEQQKKIRELEETINQAKSQIEALKKEI